ncbi:cell division protein FtsW [Gordonia crocea]|uniref:Cell division protein FtsW n=1 Tax=Gordonia crocea TaxID=589162 RepID=A0A7M3SUA0_9ACTN|nr:cell division protein FtsW [Gordonia crocea]
MSAPTVSPSTASTDKPKNRARRTELTLIGFAVGLVAVALLIVETAQSQPIGWDLVKYLAAYVALYAVAHLAVRFFAPHADPLFLPIVAILNGLGLVLIHRLDLGAARPGESVDGQAEIRNNADQQVWWTLIGIIVFVLVLALIRDHRTIARYAYTLGLGGLVFLVIPILLPNSRVYGSKNWIVTPFFSIQPGEFAKIALILFTAAVLVGKRDLFTTAGRRIGRFDVPRARDLGPLLLAWAVAILIFILQKDLGAPLLIYMTILIMLYVATDKIGWVVIGLPLFLAGAVVAYLLFTHLQTRVQIWIDPFADPTGDGLQIVQSMFGLATGGLFGTGLGSGRPNIVPFANTDFIIATIGEELGLVGLAAVLCLYLVLVIVPLPRAGNAGAAHRGHRPRQLRQTRRDRAGRHRRGPAVRRGRRRHETHPADRVDHALHFLRRVVAVGELHPGRAAHPDLQRRARAPTAPDPRPGADRHPDQRDPHRG